MKSIRIPVFCSAFLMSGALLSGAQLSWATALVPPAGYYQAVQTGDSKPEQCDPIPAPHTHELVFPSKYTGSDSARATLNVEANRRYKAMSKNITDLERGVSNSVHRYMRHGHREELQCALDWLQTWAEADALLSKDFNHTGKSMRKWALGSLAGAYLRLKFSESKPLDDYPQRVELIEEWLLKVANQVVEDWDELPLKNTNNHSYWAAWSVMAVAVATDHRELFDWSVGQFRLFASQVNDEGLLPNELKRRERALAYHNYSLPPLAMIAAFALANGVDLRGENNAALKRVAENVLQGLADKEGFARRVNARQVTEDLEENSKFAWLEPYCTLYRCSPQTLEWKQSMAPLKTYRLGGDVSTLFSHTDQSKH
jgi:poly(beta-D-mannuronate) lyase